MEKLIYTNALGMSIEIGGPPFYLQNVEGLGDVTADIQTQKSAYEDGSTLLDVILNNREIPVDFVIAADYDETYGDVSERRALIAKVLNPKLGVGTLHYENERIVRIIKCVADGVPLFPDKEGRSQRLQKGSITFIAPSVYWESLDIIEEPPYIPLFKFPFSGTRPFKTGLQQDERIITNDGDAETPLYIELQGPATNPRIINKTAGKYIKVDQDLLIGETMIIDTNPDTAKVIFIDVEGNARNVVHWLDLGSSLASFKLQIGENRIAYVADSDIRNNTFNLTWRKQYNAV